MHVLDVSRISILKNAKILQFLLVASSMYQFTFLHKNLAFHYKYSYKYTNDLSHLLLSVNRQAKTICLNIGNVYDWAGLFVPSCEGVK